MTVALMTVPIDLDLSQAWAVLIVGVLTGGASVLAYWRKGVAERHAREREALSRALADVISWKEMPFRIARRIDDSDHTKATLIQTFHQLQERLDYDCSWIRIYDEDTSQAFELLVQEVKRATGVAIRDAWAHGPQGVGFLGAAYSSDTKLAEDRFVRTARKLIS